MTFTRILAATALAVWGGAAAHAADGGAAFAAPDYVGDASLTLGQWDTGSIDRFVIAGARFVLPVGGWRLMPELTVNHDQYGVIGVSSTATLYAQDANWARGVFAGYRGQNQYPTAYVVGAGAAFFRHPNWIFSVDGFVTHQSDGLSLAQVDVAWDYYLHPNTKATLFALAYKSVQGYEVKAGTVGLRLTQRLPGTAVSLFGEAYTFHTDHDFVSNETAVGLTVSFDPPGTTQYAHDKMVPFTFANRF